MLAGKPGQLAADVWSYGTVSGEFERQCYTCICCVGILRACMCSFGVGSQASKASC